MAKKPASKKAPAKKAKAEVEVAVAEADPAVGVEEIDGRVWNVLIECHDGMALATRANAGLPAKVYCVKRS